MKKALIRIFLMWLACVTPFVLAGIYFHSPLSVVLALSLFAGSMFIPLSPILLKLWDVI